MPIGPKQVISTTRSDIINIVIDHIDTRLSDPDWVNSNWRTYHDDKRYLWVVGSGELTSSEKYLITNAYLLAGWDDVVVMNSSDNDERPGLWSVKLYVNNHY